MSRLSTVVSLVVAVILPSQVAADTVAFWRFDESPAERAAEAQTRFRDASGFGNHGRLFGRAKYVDGSGLDGTALVFDGSGMLEVPDARVFDFKDDFTIEAMVRADGGGGQYIFLRTGREGEIWIRQHVKRGIDAAPPRTAFRRHVRTSLHPSASPRPA